MEKLLIDQFLPAYTYAEYHQILVKATSQEAFQAAQNLDLSQSFVSRVLFKLRGLPIRDLRLLGFVRNMNFTYLDEKQNQEFLTGFWTNPQIDRISDKEAFIRDTTSHSIKVVWNFHFKEYTAHSTMVSTETRILCLTRKSKLFFSLYWFFIKPFSGLIRRETLKLIKAEAEKKERNPVTGH